MALKRYTPRGSGESREIPMNRTLEEALKRIPRRLDLVFLFPGRTGRGLTNVRKRFLRALEAAQNDDFRFHDIRHTTKINKILTSFNNRYQPVLLEIYRG